MSANAVGRIIYHAYWNGPERLSTRIALFGDRPQISMSDKQLALNLIERLPEDASLDIIAEQMRSLAAIRKGLDQIERGQIVPHDEVKRQLATWLSA